VAASVAAVAMKHTLEKTPETTPKFSNILPSSIPNIPYVPYFPVFSVALSIFFFTLGGLSKIQD